MAKNNRHRNLLEAARKHLAIQVARRAADIHAHTGLSEKFCVGMVMKSVMGRAN